MNSYGWCLSNLHSVIGALLFCVSVLLLVSVYGLLVKRSPLYQVASLVKSGRGWLNPE
jgi:hypothetical protein